MKKSFLIWMLLAVTFGGCHKKDDGPVQLEVPLTLSTEEFVFDAFGGWQEFVIYCTGDWTISGGTAWCQLGANSGSEESTVRVMVEAFMQAADRSVDLIIRNGLQTKVLTVTQKGISPLTQLTDKFDPNFARILEKNGYIKNAANITWGEVSNIIDLGVSESNLTSLQGIEYFTSLTKLRCDLNYLETLDVSQNLELTELYCEKNQLLALDVSKNTKLMKLYCWENRISVLDVSKNLSLNELDCDINELTTLDVSKNTELTLLYCSRNQLVMVDVSKNTRLKEFSCTGSLLTALDVSKNTALTEVKCWDNPGTGIVFPLIVWFDESNKPESLKIEKTEWTYDNKRVVLQIQKKGTGN